VCIVQCKRFSEYNAGKKKNWINFYEKKKRKIKFCSSREKLRFFFFTFFHVLTFNNTLNFVHLFFGFGVFHVDIIVIRGVEYMLWNRIVNWLIIWSEGLWDFVWRNGFWEYWDLNFFCKSDLLDKLVGNLLQRCIFANVPFL
jgi:hypothetical protein